MTGGLKIYVDVVYRTVGCDANFICNISQPTVLAQQTIATSSSSLFFGNHVLGK